MECDHCNKTFSNKYTLETHKNKIQPNVLKMELKAKSKALKTELEAKSKALKIELEVKSKVEIENRLNAPARLLQQQKLLDPDIFLQNQKNLDSALVIIEEQKIELEDQKEIELILIQKELKIEEQKKEFILKIEELKKKISEYEEKMFILASKTQTNITTTTNNNITISDWRPETIQQKVDAHYNMFHVRKGIKGLVEFTKQHILTEGSYVCTDQSREIFIYKDENGEIRKDPKAKKLKNTIKNPILKKTKELCDNDEKKLKEFKADFLIPDLDEKRKEINGFVDNNVFAKTFCLN